jgi:cytochrome c biogenesis protein CcmG/thiol:disulfide interchange protein DsbE
VSRRVLALLLVLAVAACDSQASTQTAATSPFADCSSLPTAASAPMADLPDLRLPCFTGGGQISLRELRGPAVINIWASWCGPCRTELPVMQRLHDVAGGKLTVLGVDTGDVRDRGASFAADKGVNLPTLFDEDQKLVGALARMSLPVTIFLSASGQTFVHPLPLDAPSLADMVHTHTGVSVTL